MFTKQISPHVPAAVTRVLDVTRTTGPATATDAGLQLHPAWQRLIDYCLRLGHGEIEKLKIQDGLPMAAEVTTRKIKFGS
jgi:hypothetical protein